MFDFARIAAAALVLVALPLTAARAETAEGYVQADDTTVYYATFHADQPATVTLVGLESDVDLWIYDENDNLICKSTGYGSLETCNWTPKWTGEFRIVVENSRQPHGTEFHLSI
jgi:hypothetical protein